MIHRFTFNELVQHGRDNGANIVNGMPWSFKCFGLPITHENDRCYLVFSEGKTLRMEPGVFLYVAEPQAHLEKGSGLATPEHLPEKQTPSEEGVACQSRVALDSLGETGSNRSTGAPLYASASVPSDESLMSIWVSIGSPLTGPEFLRHARAILSGPPPRTGQVATKSPDEKD